jgi:hypothetical protein
MARIESGIIVPKSVDEVFAFLNKRESHLNFIPRMIELEQTSQGDFGQTGATSKGMLNYFGIKIPVQYEIIENVPNQRLSMKGSMPYVYFTDGYDLGKRDDGTEITFRLELIPTGWTKIFSPFAGLIGKIHAWETLRNLKRELKKHEEIVSSSLRSSSQ